MEKNKLKKSPTLNPTYFILTQTFLTFLIFYLPIFFNPANAKESTPSQSAQQPKTQLNSPTEKSETIYIYQLDGSKSCDPITKNRERTRKAKREQLHTLRANQIPVLSVHYNQHPCNLLSTGMCGSDRLSANVYEIPLHQLNQALEKGFENWGNQLECDNP